MEDNIQKYLRQYIRENQETYTRDALTNKLLETGYSINDIDDAYEALEIGWDVVNLPQVQLASTFSASDKIAQKNQKRHYLEQYIQENRRDDNRLAIEKRLRVAGYSMADINYIYELLHSTLKDKNKQDIESLHRDLDWRYVESNPVGCFLFFPLVPIIAYTLVNYTENMDILLPIYSLVLATGTLLPRYVKRRYPSFAKGMMHGFWTLIVLFVCIPVVIIGAIWGICLIADYS